MRTRVNALKNHLKSKLKEVASWGKRCLPFSRKKESDALYRLLYQLVHDKEQAIGLSALQTQQAFSTQWKDLPQGNALLTDPWFKDNVARILCEEEILLQPEWFKGKEILDAGCGNGRWSYGFARLGANVTAVDVNEIALESTKKALEGFNVSKKFIHSPLEKLQEKTHGKKYDLVFSWGVIHHCHSFNQALSQVAQHVKEDGILYLYLYGRESYSFEADLQLFKERILYNSFPTQEEKMHFLLKKARGDRNRVHIFHDLYAPLINRRLSFEEVQQALEIHGFSHIERTIDHTELFIRAFKGKVVPHQQWLLPPKKPPYWFSRY